MLGYVAVVSGVAAGLLGLFSWRISQELQSFPIDYSTTKGKVFIITGANIGLGYHTAVDLAKHGAKVILACRNAKKAAEAKTKIEAESSSVVDTITLDLSSFKSIHSFVKEFNEKYDHVDVLINNAGIMALPTREETTDGLEAQIGTNHFGHFLLTALLYPKLSSYGRIINHSSGAHALAERTFPEKNLLSEKYTPWSAYGNSKLANLLFTYELNRRLKRAGNPKNIISVAVHPGYTATNLQNGRFPFWETFNQLSAMKGADGALSQIYAAVDPKVVASDNNYIGPKYVIWGPPAVQATLPISHNVTKQLKLWEESVSRTKVDFNF